MTLLLALAALPPFAVRPQNDLRLYLATAAHYASANRTGALREIRQWSPSEIARATAALQREEPRLRSVVKSPGEIAFPTVEAAVLLHAEAGLLLLQDHRLSLATPLRHGRRAPSVVAPSSGRSEEPGHDAPTRLQGSTGR